MRLMLHDSVMPRCNDVSLSLVSISHCFLSEEGLKINNPLLTNFWPRRTTVLSHYKCHQWKPEMNSVSSTIKNKIRCFCYHISKEECFAEWLEHELSELMVSDSPRLQLWNPTTFLSQFFTFSLHLFSAVQSVKPQHKIPWVKAIPW